jgi:hypothetical protein
MPPRSPEAGCGSVLVKIRAPKISFTLLEPMYFPVILKAQVVQSSPRRARRTRRGNGQMLYLSFVIFEFCGVIYRRSEFNWIFVDMYEILFLVRCVGYPFRYQLTMV